MQIQILLLLRELQRELGMAVIFVTHDVGVAVEIADRIAVMYGGRFVETGPVGQIMRDPHHPYTQGLLTSTVHGSLRGTLPRGDPRVAPGHDPPSPGLRVRAALPVRRTAVRVPAAHGGPLAPAHGALRPRRVARRRMPEFSPGARFLGDYRLLLLCRKRGGHRNSGSGTILSPVPRLPGVAGLPPGSAGFQPARSGPPTACAGKMPALPGGRRTRGGRAPELSLVRNQDDP